MQEIKDYTKLLPYTIGNIRLDRDEFAFPDVYRGQQPSLTFDIANLSDRPYEPVLMHLPPYLKMEAEPKVLLKGKKGTIKLTLDASQLKDYGLTQTSVYLSRFSGDKVSEDNEIPVSAILLPDFSRMTEKDSLNAPAMHISETDIDLSIPLIKKNKVSHDILIANSGKTPLVISKLQVFNSSVGVSLKKTVLPPDGMTKLKVTIRKRDVGNKKHHLRILMITNDRNQYQTLNPMIMEHPENSEEYKGLVVNKGIEQPSSVNPYLKRKPKKRQLSVAEFVEGIVKGDVTILSQAVTLVESVKPEHQAVSQEIIEKCLPFSGNSIRIGISGVPGAGKSTSIDVFGLHVLEKGGKLAVLAIDPSSERSKGSILGDKTRMEQLSVHPKSFIRPSPSAGSLGGVARKTRETIILCEAAGFDKIFVETVGVGQSETAVHSMVDFFLLIQLSGTGDELQGIKRGIMEMADGIVINKADGDNLERAKLAATQFRNALHLFPAPESGWIPKVLTYSGFYNLGVKEVWDMIYEYIDFVKENGYFEYRRNEQSKYWMYESINEQLRDSFYHNPKIEAMLLEKEQQVLKGNLTSFIAARSLLDTYFEDLK